jgi:hypothetical protein
VDFNAAFVLLHDAQSDTQAQSGAGANGFGGKKRVEYSGSGGFWDSCPVIAEGDPYFLVCGGG